MQIVRTFLRLLIGAFFISSAVFKILDIDLFENYVYSLGYFNFEISTVLSRLIIGGEMLLGLLLISKVAYRFAWIITTLLTLVFSVFLSIQVMGGSTDNCHCLGEFIEVSPLESLLKNAVLILLLFVVKNTTPFKFRYSSIIAVVMGFILLSIPFIITPPDFLYTDYYKDGVKVDIEAFDMYLQDENTLDELSEGKKLICLYSTNCKYCKMTAHRIASASALLDIPDSSVYCLFGGKGKKIAQFYSENDLPNWPYATIEKEQFLEITKYSFPVVLLLEDGKVIEKMDYRSFDEDKLKKLISTD